MTRPAPLQATPMDPTPSDTNSTPSAQTSAPSKPRALRLPDNPLPTVLGALLVLLLGFALTQTNERISRLEDRLTGVEDRVNERLTAQDAKLDEINLKLTALIAALNATAEVEAALDGRLLDPNSPPDDEAVN
ncbi:MAG: hypothetical protein F4Y27_01485 [Acidimicrobiaceae bacterium]|nr:hypothetical protein [Acidimicrobiaceae bacterium]MDE0699728.1 hypothetical protein [Acidimicrobiaceae bacterium]MYA73339.1 hypothetical protein [Acidimicrobiaceae bacterium]MYG54776.1 hypothetical protein [Acidimicrobiaceae bacterium]MYJ99174.1 hypothetical protein [Acidimicrobiaceae bacterium]